MKIEKNQPKYKGTATPNLLRNTHSGIYYARIRVGGKQKWKTLDTPFYSVAKLRLPDYAREVRAVSNATRIVNTGKFSVGDAMTVFKERTEASDNQPKTREFYLNGLKAIQRTWPALAGMAVNRVARGQVEEWLHRLKSKGTGFLPPGAKKSSRAGNSASTVRAALKALRDIFNIAIEKGARYDNPVEGLRGNKQRRKNLNLPTQEQFSLILEAIRNAGGGRKSIDARNLVAGLAYSGIRVGEARILTWGDVDFTNRRITVPGYKSEASRRFLPLFPDLEKLLTGMQAEEIDMRPASKVFLVGTAQNAINSACERIGAARITHHDLRHLFATRCIENGIDIPTISRWLGHSDGGALAMKTYGHLRDDHSASMAQKVSFAPSSSQVPANSPAVAEQKLN